MFVKVLCFESVRKKLAEQHQLHLRMNKDEKENDNSKSAVNLEEDICVHIFSTSVAAAARAHYSVEVVRTQL